MLLFYDNLIGIPENGGSTADHIICLMGVLCFMVRYCEVTTLSVARSDSDTMETTLFDWSPMYPCIVHNEL